MRGRTLRRLFNSQTMRVRCNSTVRPWLSWTASSVKRRLMKETDAAESQLHSLEATRRLLLRIEAVHAVPWLWVRDAPSITHAASEGTGGATMTTSTPLTSALPVLRRRTGRPRVLLAALFRNSRKP